jgi:hypothetical protein
MNKEDIKQLKTSFDNDRYEVVIADCDRHLKANQDNHVCLFFKGASLVKLGKIQYWGFLKKQQISR